MPVLALVRREEDRLAQLAATANAAHRKAMTNVLVAGQALLEAKSLVGHGGWRQWVAEHCTFSERTARVYMQAARHPERAGESLRSILQPGSRYAFCAGGEHRFTPKAIVDAARQVLGRIDLDPASCAEANIVVRARNYFTVKDDGLRQPWRGTVWCNPPYSTHKITRFVEKFVAHVQDGSVSEAIMLVNNEADVRWFKTLSNVATAVCFPTGRLRFWTPGQTHTSPPLGQAIVYAGPKPKTFGRVFRTFGTVWFA